MSGLTLRKAGRPVRTPYDENDPAQVAKMRATFDAITGRHVMRYATTDAGTEQIFPGEFPEGKAEVVVLDPYAGG